MENIVLFLMFTLFPMLKIDGQISLMPGQTCEDLVDIRIVNGVNTNSIETPWHAILELKRHSKRDRIVSYCGGSILTPTFILTAAHCVWHNVVHWSSKEHLCPTGFRNQETARECHESPGGCPGDCFRVRPEDLNIYVGVSFIRQEVRIPRQVKSIIIHPGFNKRSSKINSLKNGNDLAIIVLQDKLLFSTKVDKICLPNDQFRLHTGQNVRVNGFGAKENDRSTKKILAEILQRGYLQFKTKENCIADYEKINKPEIIQGDQICAYSTSTPQTDTCQGDSGGGLLTFVGTAPVLIGVVSFGHTKCQDLPGVYTNVQTHMDWIQQQWQDHGTSSNNSTFLEPLQPETSSPIDDYDDEYYDETADCEVGEEYENNCYLLIKSPLDWLSATSDCRARNGTLVTIKDSGTNAFIANNITNGERAWITPYGQVWKWSDGEIIAAFISGHTIETEIIEGEDLSCVYLNYNSNITTGTWSNIYCGNSLPYVCQGEKLLIGCDGGSHGIPCCPEYIYGDRTGGRSRKINFSPKTEEGCQSSCKEQYPTSIGVTQNHDGTSKCYCEFGSPELGGNANKRKTCLFPTARTGQSYKEIDGRSIVKSSHTGTGVSSLEFSGRPVAAFNPKLSSDAIFRERTVADVATPRKVPFCPYPMCQIGDECCTVQLTHGGKFECPSSCFDKFFFSV